jgi:hypothetical protein
VRHHAAGPTWGKAVEHSFVGLRQRPWQRLPQTRAFSFPLRPFVRLVTRGR